MTCKHPVYCKCDGRGILPSPPYSDLPVLCNCQGCSPMVLEPEPVAQTKGSRLQLLETLEQYKKEVERLQSLIVAYAQSTEATDLLTSQALIAEARKILGEPV